MISRRAKFQLVGGCAAVASVPAAVAIADHMPCDFVCAEKRAEELRKLANWEEEWPDEFAREKGNTIARLMWWSEARGYGFLDDMNESRDIRVDAVIFKRCGAVPETGKIYEVTWKLLGSGKTAEVIKTSDAVIEDDDTGYVWIVETKKGFDSDWSTPELAQRRWKALGGKEAGVSIFGRPPYDILGMIPEDV